MRLEPKEIPLGNGFYVSESLPVSHQLCQNLFPNYPESDASSITQLFTRLGLKEILTTPGGEVSRGVRVMSGIPYFINGNTLWRLNRLVDSFSNETFTVDNLGTITGTGLVSLADSGTQLGIVVPGTNTAYMYSDSAGLVQITDSEFIPSPATMVNSVVFITGVFIFGADQAIVFESDTNDGLSYDAANFFIYGNAKNNIVGLHEYNEQLFVFSDINCAVYAPTNLNELGALFTKVKGYEFTKGLSSQFAIYDLGESFVMMGQGFNETPKIYQFTGNEFTPISTTSIEQILERYTSEEIKKAFGFNYTFRGETFAVFSMKNNTFKYCMKATKMAGKKVWVEDRSENLANKDRWRVNGLVTAYDRLLCSDSEGGLIGELAEGERTDYGNLIRYDFSLPPISSGTKEIFYRYFLLEVEAGLATGDDELDVEMNYSDDGKVFPDNGWRTRGMGLKGEYQRILRWSNLGRSRTPRTFRFRMTKPGKYVIIRAWVGVDGN
ncbi:MAG TPA: hypothetical protein EYN67_10270 [Flavobacteriales bacterium]|nr:hypothetical protein [Flavobacteriales bacterium]